MKPKPDLDPTNLIRATAAETRAAAKLREQEQLEARRAALDEQASAYNSAEDRIQIWERLHALSLPLRPSHPLVRVIAAQTHLTLKDVIDEQRRRSERAALNS
jgi:hypothetical protein